jgi:hypothetical protein
MRERERIIAREEKKKERTGQRERERERDRERERERESKRVVNGNYRLRYRYRPTFRPISIPKCRFRPFSELSVSAEISARLGTEILAGKNCLK